jgi:hypothetical protein
MREPDRTVTRTPIWIALLAGPTAWTLHEVGSYALVKLACETGFSFMLHIVTLLALGVCGLGVYLGVRAYGTHIHQPQNSAEFVAGAGVLVSVIFAFAIVMEGLPNAVLSPCL